MYRNKHKHSDYDLSEDVRKIKEALSDASHDLKGKASEMFFDTIENAKEKTVAAQDDMAEYVAERPFKSLGIVLLAGLVFGYFLGRK